MIWFLSILCVILVGLLATSLYYLYRFATLVFRIEDEIEESLDILDSCYGRISQVLEVPVGSDDPFVKTVVDEIKRAQEAILLVANKVTEGWKAPEENERGQEAKEG